MADEFPARPTHIIRERDGARARPALARTHGACCSPTAPRRRSFARSPDSSPRPSSASAVIRPCRRCWRRPLRGIPTLIHEQNAVMGRANRFARRRACTRSRQAFRARARSRAGHSPPQSDAHGQPGADRRCWPPPKGLSGSPPRTGRFFRLLVFGGSQGAKILAGHRAGHDPKTLDYQSAYAAPAFPTDARRGYRTRAHNVSAARDTHAPTSRRAARISRRGSARRTLVVCRSGAATVADHRCDRTAQRSSFRCRMRSTRTSSPTQACWKGRRRDAVAPGRSV